MIGSAVPSLLVSSLPHARPYTDEETGDGRFEEPGASECRAFK